LSYTRFPFACLLPSAAAKAKIQSIDGDYQPGRQFS